MNIPEPIKVDITDISKVANFDHFIQEVKDSYDTFLTDCFEKCGFTKNYILEHADDFSTVSRLDGAWTIYKWKGISIFTIYTKRDFDEVTEHPISDKAIYQCIYQADFYPRNNITE